MDTPVDRKVLHLFFRGLSAVGGISLYVKLHGVARSKFKRRLCDLQSYDRL